MQLYLIRHGQSTNNYLLAQTGAENGRMFDPELTELGMLQAAALAGFLKSQAELAPEQLQPPRTIQLTHLYASPMVRAVGTGLPTARALGLPLVAWRDLHEGGGLYLESEDGELVGQPGPDRAAMRRRFPDLVWPAELGEGGWWNRPFEEKEERLPRARRVIRDLLARHAGTDDRVAFFTHAAFTNYFLGALLMQVQNGDSGEWRLPAWFAMYNCAITRVDFRVDHEVVVIYSGRVDHLPEGMISG